MAHGDPPPPPSKIWSDAFGWIDPPQAPVIQRGCICPPTSEKTCEAPMCPRRATNAPPVR